MGHLKVVELYTSGLIIIILLFIKLPHMWANSRWRKFLDYYILQFCLLQYFFFNSKI